MAVTLILKNTTASIVVLPGTGVQLPASGQDNYTGLTSLILKVVASAGVRSLVAAGTVLVNDGTSDLSVMKAVNYLDILWSTVAHQGVALLTPGHISGAQMTWISVTTVEFGSAGGMSVAADSTGAAPISWTGVLSANITVAGPGGLQTGQAEAADTWYQVLVIADTTGVNAPAALLVPAGVGFSQAGYDIFRRVGWVRNNGSSAFISFFQSGKGSERTILYNDSVSNLRPLNNGSATAFTSVSLTGFVPPIGRAQVFLLLAFNNSGAGGLGGDDLRVRPADSALTNVPWKLQPGVIVLSDMQIPVVMFTDASQVVQYQVTRATNTADIVVSGYTDDL
jgi:hypothetical protein